MKKTITVSAFVLLAVLAVFSYAPTPHTPSILVQSQFLNQTAGIGSTTLFAPTNDNEFIVHAYITSNNCTATNNGGATVLISWNDGLANESVAVAQNSCPAVGVPGFGQGSFLIHSAGGTSISFFTGDNSGDPYNLYLTLERL